MGGQLGGIREGFAVKPGKPGDQGLGIGCCEQGFVVLGAQVGRHGPGIGGFVEARFLKADREGAHRPAAAGLQQGGDERRINAARKEGAQGHISKALVLHRFAQGLLKGVEGFCLIGKGVGQTLGDGGAQTPPRLGYRQWLGQASAKGKRSKCPGRS